MDFEILSVQPIALASHVPPDELPTHGRRSDIWEDLWEDIWEDIWEGDNTDFLHKCDYLPDLEHSATVLCAPLLLPRVAAVLPRVPMPLGWMKGI